MQGRTNIDPLSASESISCLTVCTVDAVVHWPTRLGEVGTRLGEQGWERYKAKMETFSSPELHTLSVGSEVSTPELSEGSEVTGVVGENKSSVPDMYSTRGSEVTWGCRVNRKSTPLS